MIQVHAVDRHNTARPGFYLTALSADSAGVLVFNTTGLVRPQAIQQGFNFQITGAAATVEFTLADYAQAQHQPASVPWNPPITVPASGEIAVAPGLFASALRITFSGPATLYIGVM